MPWEKAQKLDVKSLTNDVKLIISSVANLQAEPDHVSVFIPFDLCILDKVIVEIVIYKKKGRTDAVLGEMSSRLKKFLEDNYFPGISVGVFVKVVNPKHCVSSHD